MKPEIKRKWIAALRSRKYTQGRAFLRTYDDEYCCLGVLCDLAVKDGAAQWIDVGGSLALSPKDRDHDWNSGLPPQAVFDWANLDRSQVLGEMLDLVFDNDERRYSFQTIADRIELYVEET